MNAQFAAAVTRLNSAVVGKLCANVVSVSGVEIDAIFDNAFALGSVGPYGMASTQPTLTLATTSVPADPVGAACVVDGINYVVAAHEPDGTGISRLTLEAA